MGQKSAMKSNRKSIPVDIRLTVLTEAGFRCAVPTCRSILALDLHHLQEVSEEGKNEPSNLIALCPTCHALYHRGTIPRESLYVWKQLLIALMQAFDKQTIDDLLFLDTVGSNVNENNVAEITKNTLALSGDGVLKFSRLIAAGLAGYLVITNNAWQLVSYTVFLTHKGKKLVSDWKAGNCSMLEGLDSSNMSELIPVE
jgi:hypothetical protein